MTNPIVAGDLEQIHAGLNTDKFADGTVVVTGCAGFLGFYTLTYLVRYARALGIRRVIALDNFKIGRPAWIDELARDPVLDLQQFDIAAQPMESIAGASEATHVIHAASIASPPFYRKYPLATIDANIWGLRRLLDFYRGSKSLRGFLFFSSSEIYGDPAADKIPTSEDYNGNVACVGPRACYDESKRFGETMCYVFAKTEGVPITIARPFNNYGPGMRVSDERLPADFARCILERRDIVMFSDGKPTRTFCYISDAITGYFKVLLHDRFASFNVGTERPEISVRDFANLYRDASQEVFGFTPDVRFETSDDAEYLTDNPNRRCPDITKARTELAYDPKVPVDIGVRRYLEFLKHDLAGQGAA